MATKQQSLSPRKVTLRVSTRFEQRKVTASVAVVGEAHLADGASVELEMVSSRANKVVHTRTIKRLLRGARGLASFPMGNVPSGCCSFRAVLIDRFGVRHPTDILQDKWSGDDYPWLGTADGVTRKVPAPWTAVETRTTRGGMAVSCWGREYQFDRRDFLTRVRTAGEQVLAGPVRLVARADGKEVRWKSGPMDPIAAEPDQAVFSRQMSGAGLMVTSHTAVEFDGMVRIDWTLGSRKRVRLDQLAIEMPIHPRHAENLCFFPGSWGSASNAMALPVDGMTAGFKPFVWLGDNQRGLAWFCESDENWFNADPNGVTEIRREGDAVVLRVHLVSSPVNVVPGSGDGTEFTGLGTEREAGAHTVAGLRYTFGLHATPVKPVERDAWDHRIVCIGQDDLVGPTGGLDVSPSRLDRLAEAGVRTIVVFEYWTDAEGHSRTTHGKQLKKLIKACHDRGMKVLLYFSFLISDLASEWRDFGKDCVVMPKGGYPVFHYLPQPEQSAWRVCLKSVWQDFLAEGIAHVMDEFDVDGIYHDGTEYPFGCCNTEHDCGTLRADGGVALSYPIFGVRGAMRRIYNVVRSRKPDGQLNIHNSTCMTIPTLGWGTSYWDGEQFQNIRHGDAEIDELLPLDAFRAEFMGHQWGVPAEFLCYNEPFTHEEAWSFCLLHDVPVRPGSDDKHLELTSKIWRVMDEFGRKESEWLPYWDNGDYVTVSGAEAYASLYRHPDNGVLAVVSNLSRKAGRITAKLDAARLGLGDSRLAATDAITGKSMRITAGTLDVKLPSFGWKLVRIAPAR